MILNDIVRIAKESGWNTIITQGDKEVYYLDFIYKTTHSQPFLFSTQWREDDTVEFIRDIKEMEYNITSENYLEQFLETVNVPIPIEKYFLLLRTLDEIKTRIWLLWLKLSIDIEREDRYKHFPWYTWN